MKNKTNLYEIYTVLRNHFGPQNWWPGDSAFEIIVGAVLTQNTNWQNVERAINNLKAKNSLSIDKIYKMKHDDLAEIIKPAGYFNVKAKRLKNVIVFIVEKYHGDLDKMFSQDLYVLREELLGINGVGEETADSLLLYAGEKPIFVVDAYTRRLVERHKFLKQGCSYKEIQNFFMKNLKHDVELFNEYHALVVALGKEFCKTKPQCAKCPVKSSRSLYVHKITL
ncbi:endonuclease III domain-containing protein [bacterium]|nr:endonuclease III domain-containing protein [bacterium]